MPTIVAGRGAGSRCSGPIAIDRVLVGLLQSLEATSLFGNRQRRAFSLLKDPRSTRLTGESHDGRMLLPERLSSHPPNGEEVMSTNNTPSLVLQQTADQKLADGLAKHELLPANRSRPKTSSPSCKPEARALWPRKRPGLPGEPRSRRLATSARSPTRSFRR